MRHRSFVGNPNFALSLFVFVVDWFWGLIMGMGDARGLLFAPSPSHTHTCTRAHTRTHLFDQGELGGLAAAHGARAGDESRAVQGGGRRGGCLQDVPKSKSELTEHRHLLSSLVSTVVSWGMLDTNPHTTRRCALRKKWVGTRRLHAKVRVVANRYAIGNRAENRRRAGSAINPSFRFG
jgi:hypothetical protein